MEVGAVKQAFNNEVILLKKKLNQAKIQIIHKLTRKAKQLAEKKAPEPLKEKLKRKAESAVNEVLIIKKIKPKDIAKFTVTHQGELKDFLNKPTVDNDKACARLLLHKALQEKYKFIRGRFSNIPIQDLFMSRVERRKMKKEEKEKQKNKKKGKDNKVVNSEGDWDVEDVIGDKSKLSDGGDSDNEVSDEENGKEDSHNSNSEKEENESEENGKEDSHNSNSEKEENESEENGKEDSHNSNSEKEENESEENGKKDSHSSNSEKEENESEREESEHSGSENESDDVVENVQQDNSESEAEMSEPEIQEVKASIKLSPKDKAPVENNSKQIVNKEIKTKAKKNPEKKQKDINKNKNFSEKMQQKKTMKDSSGPVVENKIVDPFFITSTGENYLSVVEPRGPDEVKDEHKQGNRKLRRAAMFGHVPNIKPRQNNNYRDDNRFNNKNSYERGSKDNKFNNRQEFSDRRFNSREFSDRKSFNNDFNDRKRFNDKSNDEKTEKLHPSWEAKKKKSGILPFEGKKIVFD